MTDAVLFDLDGTLLDHVGAASRAVTAWAAGIDPGSGGDEALAALWMALEREHFDAYLSGNCSFQEQRRRRLRAFLAELGLPVDENCLDDQFSDYLRHYEASWVAYPDVADTLIALRGSGYRLGVLTNGDGRQQRRKLASVGLGNGFDMVFCSSELGAAKPDPDAFRLAVRQLGHRPQHLWYVGDDLHVDCLAARRAGLNAAWLNRTTRRTDLPVEQIEIDRLTGLPGLLPVVPGVSTAASGAIWTPALDRFADMMGQDVTWAVTGSAALALYGATVTPRDVDVITDMAGLATLRRLVGVGAVDQPFESSDVTAEARLRFDLDDTTFEILVGVRNRRPDGTWSARATPDDRLWMPSGEKKVPVLPLSALRRIAEARNRTEHCAAIRARLRQAGIEDRALPV